MATPVKVFVKNPPAGPVKVTVTNPEQQIRTIEVSPTLVPGPGVPAGGNTNDLLQKASNSDYDDEWTDEITVDKLTFDTAAAETLTNQGEMAWDAAEETVAIRLNGFVLNTGSHLIFHVRNATGSTIAKGVPVKFSGTTGNSGRLLIAPWDGTGSSTYFMGLTGEELLNNEDGFVIARGKLSGLQTNGANYGETWTDNTIVYAGTGSGANSLTSTKPPAPAKLIQIFVVVNAHVSDGYLFVRPTLGSNIADDEGVTLTSLTEGDMLLAQSNGVFENKAVSGDATLASTGALSLTSTAISGKTTATLVGTEEVLVNDGGTLKKTTAQDIADLGGGGGGMADPGANGIVVRTALNVTTARTLTAGTNVSVSNGDGVSGNPTVNVADASTTAKGVVELATSAETTAGLAVQASDTRLSDARTPTLHASTHVTGGTDKIRDASASQDGLMTTAYASKLDGIEAGADVTDATNVAAAIDGASAKTTPVDADTVGLIDSAASNVLKKLSWSNIKATLKTYFDTLYPSGSGTSSGTNTGDQNLFQTIAVAGQSNVVADTTTDTLTLVAGSNVTITTDAGTDTITIASTGGAGDVVGPASSTDNAVAVFDGTTGKLIQNTPMTVDPATGKAVINVSPNTGQALLIQGTDRGGYIGTSGYGNGIAVSDIVEVTNGKGFSSTSSSGTVGHFMLRGDTDANVASLQNCSVNGKGSNPQTLRIYEDYPSTGNYERLTISAAAGTNTIKPEAAGTGTASKVDYHLTATDVRVTSGSGSPEGVVTAPVGTTYHRTDGGTGTTVYIKESGTGNTGWVAVAAGGGSGITELTGDVTAGPGSGSQAATLATNLKTGTIGITIDGAGSAITTGIKGDVMVPFACTITKVTMLADQSGSAVVDIWKDTYANYPPTGADTITASAKPTISAATKSEDATLTGWATSISAGNTLRFNVDSASTITRLTLILTVTKTA